MSYIFKTNLVPENKYKVKCPYLMSPEGVCVHNTANDAPAENEIKYMVTNDNQVSFHVAVDDVSVVQGIPFDRNAWHAGDGGNGDGNRKYLAVEICYSKSGGDRFIQAEKNAAKWIAETLKNHNWTIANVKKHQDFSGKYCPHRTLDMGWQRFLDMVQEEQNQLNTANVQEAVSQPAQRTYAHKIGEHVVFSTCYRASTDPISAHLSAAQMSKKHGVITRIVDAANPYLIDDGLCWVNDGDIRGLYTAPAPAPKPEPQVSYYLRYTGNTVSIADALQTVGVDNSFANRQKIAAKNGITGYRGSADQNNKLLSLLKNGKLIK